MTKTEAKKAINKAVYQFAESLGYQMFDTEDGSRVTFADSDYTTSDDSIEYHRSQHDAICLNWANDKIKADVDKINEFAKAQVQQYLG